MVEETLPAGTTLIEGSLQSNAVNSTLADGVLTLYFAPGSHPGTIRYDVFGYLPGEYRALPTRIRSAYEPGEQHLGPAGALRVLTPGERRPTRTRPRPTSSRPRQGPVRRRPARRGRRPARGALRRLHPPRRGRPRGRRADAPDDPHQGLPAAEGRPVLRGPQGEGPRAGHPVRRGAGRRPRLPRHRRARAGVPGLARDRRGELPRRRPGRRGPPPARQDARRDRLPARPLARVSRHRVDRDRLLRPLAAARRVGRQGDHRPGPPQGAGRRRA